MAPEKFYELTQLFHPEGQVPSITRMCILVPGIPLSENSCINYRNPHCQAAYFSTDYVDYISIFYVRVGLLENMRFLRVT
jgi:hypothetical protein